MEKLVIYTDGGCSGNPGPGGWAYLVNTETGTMQRSGSDKLTTNNRMELTAVIKALDSIKQSETLRQRKIDIYTDSIYVKNGITEWIKTWERNGYLTASRKPVKNKDLWVELNKFSSILQLSWHWVAGHAGNRYNEECDRLVQEEIALIKRNYS